MSTVYLPSPPYRELGLPICIQLEPYKLEANITMESLTQTPQVFTPVSSAAHVSSCPFLKYSTMVLRSTAPEMGPSRPFISAGNVSKRSRWTDFEELQGHNVCVLTGLVDPTPSPVSLEPSSTIPLPFSLELKYSFKPRSGLPTFTSSTFVPLSAMSFLSAVERSSILRSWCSSNQDSGKDSVVAKFTKFWKFCSQVAVSPILAFESRVAKYILWLEVEGRISPKSAKQYLSAMSTAHSWLSVEFSTLSKFVGHMVRNLQILLADTSGDDHIVAFPSQILLVVVKDGLNAT